MLWLISVDCTAHWKITFKKINSRLFFTECGSTFYGRNNAFENPDSVFCGLSSLIGRMILGQDVAVIYLFKWNAINIYCFLNDWKISDNLEFGRQNVNRY